MRCKECRCELHRQIETYNADRLGRVICEKCGAETDEILRCNCCETILSKEEIKGYVKIYPDGQINFYSILCNKCKEKKRQEKI